MITINTMIIIASTKLLKDEGLERFQNLPKSRRSK